MQYFRSDLSCRRFNSIIGRLYDVTPLAPVLHLTRGHAYSHNQVTHRSATNKLIFWVNFFAEYIQDAFISGVLLFFKLIQ